MSRVEPGKIITKKQKLILTTTLVAGSALAIVATVKYRGAIEAAKVAGTLEWIDECNSKGFDVMVLSQQITRPWFDQLPEIASIHA